MESSVKSRSVKKGDPPPAPSSNTGWRGQVRLQGPSKYAAQVSGLVGEERRQKLNQCYEKDRKRPPGYKRPGNRKRKKPSCESLSQPCQVKEEKDAAHVLQPPALQDDSDAEFSFPSPCKFARLCQVKEEKDAAHVLQPPVLQDDSDAEFYFPSPFKSPRLCQVKEEKEAAQVLPPPILQDDSDVEVSFPSPCKSLRLCQVKEEKEAAHVLPPPVLQDGSDAEVPFPSPCKSPRLCQVKEEDDSDAELSFPSPFQCLSVPQRPPPNWHAEMEKLRDELAQVNAEKDRIERKLREELAQVNAEKERVQRRLDWHESVRDWISSTGAAAAVHMARHGWVPTWVRFEGARVRQSTRPLS